MSRIPRSVTLTVRMTKEIKSRLDDASKNMPFKISTTSIVERGIELALAELSMIMGEPAIEKYAAIVKQTQEEEAKAKTLEAAQ